MEIRLNKYLSDAGVCSRREADKLIEMGRITVDGQIGQMGMKVSEGQVVCLDHQMVNVREKTVLLAVNKPAGIVCTEEKREKHNIIDFLHYPIRITYIGRLDKDSEGLLLMTNNGDIINKIMRAGNEHEKEYIVTVNRPVTQEFLEKMGAGVPILDTVTRKCRVEKVGKMQFRIILTQGLNRQIRRMCEALGYRVVRLVRVRIMNIKLGDLRPGQYRELTESETQKLYELIQNSSNEPVRWKEGKN